MSEALIFASTNPQYDDRLFNELQVQYMKIASSEQAQNIGRTCCDQKLFLTFRTISVHNMFSPCSAKRRASDKDLPVRINMIYPCFFSELCIKSRSYSEPPPTFFRSVNPIQSRVGRFCSLFTTAGTPKIFHLLALQ